ncbi:drug/metabolite transporter (DMT)-like permease [Chitinivorax tropicus]|uniref:Drug/metabolite transporter (DMT)-like permease n=1 Tax=Chitinivorax tropicus TaxID=714531 RepID=A0A840MEY0_9PROT|nr:DMT family transporter [Chitinivorax tropicus]MBB5017238.1 drug/metabolite transporter (DMT)-like permease [Chitinivorax tropicus]
MKAAIALPLPSIGRPASSHAGMIALAITVLIWASFFLSLRAGAKAQLPAAELALIRFGPAGLCFLPTLIHSWHRIITVPKRYLLGMIATGGLPYFLIACMGMRHAPVSDGSTLIPGTIPLFVALIGTLFYKQHTPRHLYVALGLISAGAAIILLFNHGQGDLLHGYGLFLLGSLMWANFTLCLRLSGLKPAEGGAVIAISSLLVLLVWFVAGHPPTQLGNMPLSALAFHTLVQGIGVGLLATLTYAYAITKLGAPKSAAAGALTPVLASLLAVIIFDETPGLPSLLGMVVIVIGVILASRPNTAHVTTKQ